MNRKSLAVILMVALVPFSLAGCGSVLRKAMVVRESQAAERICVEGCNCTDCICCGTAQGDGSSLNAVPGETQQESANESKPEETGTEEKDIGEGLTSAEKGDMAKNTEENTEDEETEERAPEEDGTQEETTGEEEAELSEIEKLTEGELAARREQQKNFDEARQMLYTLKNSKDKTAKINQMDRQILANNAYDFSKENIVFIGDSITEGITSAVDKNGNMISYVTYADSYLDFQRVLNHGKGGRLFTDYGGKDLSLAMNFDKVTNIDSDIIVVFAGVNDFLCTPAGKQFGDVNNDTSTAGYCGAVRYFMKQLAQYYSDREIFFVTMYNVSKKAECTYTDVKVQPTLGDYMEVQRQLASEYGFHIIELYDTGFMDCTNKESADYYLRDGLHPKDNGNIVLGEHIAAELSLYFGQKE